MSARVPALRARGESAAAARQPAGEAGGEGKTGQAVRWATRLRGWPSFSHDLALRGYSQTVSARAKGLSDRGHPGAPAAHLFTSKHKIINNRKEPMLQN